MAGLRCVNVGYGRREIIDAVSRQMGVLPYYNTFFHTTHPPVVELTKLLAQVSPNQFNRVFLTNSGSESNDTVVRMVRHYWNTLGQPSRQILISRKNAYHGSTLAAASLGGMTPMHKQGGLIPGIEHIDQPYWYQCGGDLSRDEFGLVAARALETKIEELGAENVAAFIGEPVQGAGDVIVPPDTYWPEIGRICEKYGILLVSDKVICGFGRTGNWFGCETFGMTPDLMPIAKGLSSGYLPIGGVLVNDRVADVIAQDGGEFQHGFTYSGHPVACAAAIANIRIMREERLIETVAADTAPYFQHRLREFESHPLVGEVRGIGLFAALELVRDKASRSLFEPQGKVGALCRDTCFANGLVMRAVQDSMLLSPPLVISHAEIDELIDKARYCLDLTADKLDGLF